MKTLLADGYHFVLLSICVVAKAQAAETLEATAGNRQTAAAGSAGSGTRDGGNRSSCVVE
jgi:hypothetical protein